MAQHDGSYKLLFSHPEMVRDLLLGFVHEDWVQELDFDSLELVKNSFISTRLHARDEDLIWRLRWRDRWFYLYILLEFQSSIDPFMALRVMVYVGLLYQDLIRQNQIKAGELLPPVLPIVLYNGTYRWSSAVSVQELIQPVAGLEQYHPHLSYLLLDQQHYQELDDISDLKNLVAALFELENSRTAYDIQQVVLKLLAWLTQPEQETLRRAFATWLNRVLIPNRLLPTESVPVVNSLQEVNAMLAETVQKWYAEAEAQGMAKGLEKGLEQGLEKGLERGLERGLEKGLATGLKKGLEKGLEQGLEQGLEKGLTTGLKKGKMEGLAISLLQLLTVRFGTQSKIVRQQIANLNQAQLMHGLTEVLTAHSVAEVLSAAEAITDQEDDEAEI